jgi:Putative Actinobacterial Holin-X, holin superfamily III
MATPPSTEQRPPEDKSVGELVIDISEKTSVLVREEIELAKAEVSEKARKLLQGGVAGLAAGIFLIACLAMLMHAFAWLLNDLFFGDTIWLGFLVEAFIWLAVAGAAGLIAYRSFEAGSPPTPDMAIEEAKLTKETFEGGPTPPPRGAEENGR